MKRLLLLTLICLLLAVLTLVLPYAQEVQDGNVVHTVNGYDIDIAWLQLFIYCIIIIVSDIRQSTITALIALVLCPSFFLFFILLSTDIMLYCPADLIFGKGYYFAIGIAIIFWILHIFNLILIIRGSKVKTNSLKSI